MEITKGWLLSPLEEDDRCQVSSAASPGVCALAGNSRGTFSLRSSIAATLSARVTRGPGTGLDLRKELWNVGEERKWASKGPALINSLASNLWHPCVAPSASPCERLIGRLRATGRLIYEPG